MHALCRVLSLLLHLGYRWPRTRRGCFFFLFCGATHQVVAAAIAGAVAGVLIAALVIRLEKLGVYAVGIAGGLVAALYTNGFVMTHVYNHFSAHQQSWMPYAYAGLLAIIGCLLAIKLERLIIILTTALGGAYATGWGIIRLSYGSDHADLVPLFLFSGNGCEGSFCKVALVCIVCLGLVGALVQLRCTAVVRVGSQRAEVRRTWLWSTRMTPRFCSFAMTR